MVTAENIMDNKCVFLTSDGLSDRMQELFFKRMGKARELIKVIVVPTAGICSDGARESFAICLHELMKMGIQYENIMVYNLELLLSKGYARTYSSYISRIPMIARLLTAEELKTFDAIIVSGGEGSVLCTEMNRTGLVSELGQAVKEGLVYVGISAGSMFAAGTFENGLHLIENPIIPHWDGEPMLDFPDDNRDIHLKDGQAVYIHDDRIELL